MSREAITAWKLFTETCHMFLAADFHNYVNEIEVLEHLFASAYMFLVDACVLTSEGSINIWEIKHEAVFKIFIKYRAYIQPKIHDARTGNTTIDLFKLALLEVERTRFLCYIHFGDLGPIHSTFFREAEVLLRYPLCIEVRNAFYEWSLTNVNTSGLYKSYENENTNPEHRLSHFKASGRIISKDICVTNSAHLAVPTRLKSSDVCLNRNRSVHGCNGNKPISSDSNLPTEFDDIENGYNEVNNPERVAETRCTFPNCSKVFRSKNGYKYHLASGHIAKPLVTRFSCPYPGCNSTYKNTTGLKYHLIRKHSPSTQDRGC